MTMPITCPIPMTLLSLKGLGSDQKSDHTGKYAGFNPEKIIGKSILMPTKEDGTIDRGKIVDYAEEYEGQLEKPRAYQVQG